MNRAIPHAVAASLALFTLSDAPLDRPATTGTGPGAPARATPAERAAEPAKRVPPARAAPGKVAAPGQLAAPGTPGAPGAPAGAEKSVGGAKAVGAGQAAEAPRSGTPAAPTDEKPCVPVKPCAID
jgi:hypothetical protein